MRPFPDWDEHDDEAAARIRAHAKAIVDRGGEGERLANSGPAIATRRLRYGRKQAVVAICSPRRRSADEFYATVLIRLGPTTRRRHVYGVDSMQALILALLWTSLVVRSEFPRIRWHRLRRKHSKWDWDAGFPLISSVFPTFEAKIRDDFERFHSRANRKYEAAMKPAARRNPIAPRRARKKPRT